MQTPVQFIATIEMQYRQRQFNERRKMEAELGTAKFDAYADFATAILRHIQSGGSLIDDEAFAIRDRLGLD